MTIEQLRENLRFQFALLQFLIAPFVFRVVFRVGKNRRQEDDALSIGRPNRTIGAGRDVGHLMRRSVQAAAFRGEIRHPDLRRISRLRGPNQPFTVRGKAGPLFVVRRLIQTTRFTSGSRHNPKMRNLRVRLQVHIDGIEHDPPSIRRRHRRADPFELHHVFEREGALGAGGRGARRRLRQQRAGESERNDQDFPRHVLISV